MMQRHRGQPMHSLTRFATSLFLLLSVALPSVVHGQAEWTDADTRRVVDNTTTLLLSSDLSPGAQHQYGHDPSK